MEHENKTIEILLHNIEYWYDDGQDMPDHEEEHVCYMISQGYREGELNDGDETKGNRGWWKINNK